jgi:hypothetical protein
MEMCGQNYDPDALRPETALGTHWIGELMGLRAGLDPVEKKNLLPLPGIALRFLPLQNYPLIHV